MNLNLIDLLGPLFSGLSGHAPLKQAESGGFAALLQEVQAALAGEAEPAPVLANEEVAIEETAPVDTERVETDGPPPHRAQPEVALPEVALEHAMHSNGAPFVPYQLPTDAPEDVPIPEGEVAVPQLGVGVDDAPNEEVTAATPVPEVVVPVEAKSQAVVPLPEVVVPVEAKSQAVRPVPEAVVPVGAKSLVVRPVPEVVVPVGAKSLVVRPVPEVVVPVGAKSQAAVMPVMFESPRRLSGSFALPVGFAAARAAPSPAMGSLLPVAGLQHRAVRAVEVLTAVADGVAPSADAGSKDFAPEFAKTPEQLAVKPVVELSGLRSTSARLVEASTTVVEPVRVQAAAVAQRAGPMDDNAQLPEPKAPAPVEPPPVQEEFLPAAAVQHRALRAVEVLSALSSGSSPRKVVAVTQPLPAEVSSPPAEGFAIAPKVTVARSDAASPPVPAAVPIQVAPDEMPVLPVAEQVAMAKSAGNLPAPMEQTAKPSADLAMRLAERPAVLIEPVVQAVVQSVRQTGGNGEQTIVVRLVPESLGELHVTVKTVKESVEIVLMSSNQHVRSTLEHQLHALRDTLVREGFDVSKATVAMPVTTENDVQTSFSRAGSGQQYGGERQSGQQPYQGASGREQEHPNRNRSWNPHNGRLNMYV